MSRTLCLLSGCTAVGKTGLALAWAERHQAEIVSCDSLLFYQGMEVGTAKPNSAERARVPHHCIDLAPTHQQLNIRAFVAAARAAIEDIQRRGRRVLITGGSGFYLQAFFRPVADEYTVDPVIRARVRSLESDGLAALVAALRQASPEGIEQIDLENPRRVARALERVWLSGKSLRALAEEFSAQAGPFDEYPKQFVLLERSKADLSARIEVRTQKMLRAGLIDEVRRLRAAGIAENPSAARAIGYREVLAALEGGNPEEDKLAAEIALNTRRLAAKQRKWFRNQTPWALKRDAASATAGNLFF